MKINEEKIKEILDRNVEQIITKEEPQKNFIPENSYALSMVSMLPIQYFI